MGGLLDIFNLSIYPFSFFLNIFKLYLTGTFTKRRKR